MALGRPLSQIGNPDLKTVLNDIVTGACILGSGGGGPLAVGKQLADDIVKIGEPTLIDPQDVDDVALMAVSAVIGSPDAAESGPFPYEIVNIAYKQLSRTLGKELSCVLAGEIGAGNSLIPLIVSASLGIPMVDGDGARRAIPALEMVTYASHNLPLSPIVLANSAQSVTFDAANATFADATTRGIISSGAWQEDAGIAFWTMDGRTMKGAIIPNTLTYALELGQILRVANEQKQDPVAAVTGYLGGSVVFRGKLAAVKAQTQGGFDYGVLTLKASDGDAEAFIYNQNENLILWNSTQPQPLIMAPDLICFLTTDGETFSNADLQDPQEWTRLQSKEVVLIGASAVEALRAPSIVTAFIAALRAIGYGGPYVPFTAIGVAV